MNLVKGSAALLFFSVILGSCFNAPEFPNKPEIVLQDIFFKDYATGADSLFLQIGFKDGDGDLGLRSQDDSEPYNNGNYTLSTYSGQLQKLSFRTQSFTLAKDTIRSYDIIDIPDPTQGKLTLFRTRKDPLFTNLPEHSCADYEIKEFVIEEADRDALYPDAKVRRTFLDKGIRYLIIYDTIYFEYNPNHYNIQLKFYEKVDPLNADPSKRYQEINVRKQFCSTFDGRFPILSEPQKALDGSLTYAMRSQGFTIVMGGKTLKLQVFIRDRALNESNTIETEDFTLQGITRR